MPPLDPGRSRARRYLLGHERLVAEVRWHPAWLVRPALVVVAAVVVGSYLALTVDQDSPLLDLAGLAFLGSLAYLAWKMVEWSSERLVVTDRRLIMITGLFTRRVGVMPLRKVTDMTFERPLVGRVLGNYGWGTFVLESAGQDQAMHRIPYLPEPERLYVQVSGEIFGDEGLYGGSPARSDLEDEDEAATATVDRPVGPPVPAREDTQEIPVARERRGSPSDDGPPRGGPPED